MIGNLRIQRARLDAVQQQLYRSAFCASCHALHDVGGRMSSLLTSYDQTALAVVLAGMSPPSEREWRGCTALPWRTVGVQPLDAQATALLGALGIGAAVAKLRDDVADGDRPLVKRLVLRLLRGAHARAVIALRKLAFPISMLAELPERQAAVERAVAPKLRELAEPTARLCGQVFAHAARIRSRPGDAPALADFGHAIGAWVYLLDAWLDIGPDVRLGRFNALIAASAENVCADAVAGELAAQVHAARCAIAEVDLGAHGAIVSALLQGMDARSSAVASAVGSQPGSSFAPRDLRQAGDCDLACAACDAGPACCDLACCADIGCCWTAEASERRAARRVKRAERRGRGLTDADLSDVLGATGIAATDLLPEGRVDIHGLVFDATAETGVIEKDSRVTVVGVVRGRLLVERAVRTP